MNTSLLHDYRYALPELHPYINWAYFLHAWHLPASLAQDICKPQLRKNTPQAIQAAELMADAWQELRLMHQAGYVARARVLIAKACSRTDDIVLQTGERIPLLRQQHRRHQEPCLCLSDFLPPASLGRPGRVGLFVSTMDAEAELRHPADPYRHLLAQTLADRLAEACIERAHQHVRTRLWAYAPQEQLTPQQLFAERYQGIRPAVGYPSLPDQSINFILARILDFESMGIQLTESGAMRPHASTSGLLIAHPAARHFSVGPIGDDQLRDYAKRRGISPDALRRFLPRG